ncbi:histidine kinase [Undibacterium cyanobacteriorum]|uniref:Histidine kinase n=1 Tax=Undibacterium cyanobacteriorum TaxID=3073561 RepID=A0ABY9RI85_9BURK|nr:histidine kinase [Undibacterium sp. 20NA77.5]WMW80882.1 histidine kinase [Undibacterium sp. 20NA77.5]
MTSIVTRQGLQRIEPITEASLMGYSFLIWMFVAVTHAIAGALDSGSVHFGQTQSVLVLEYCLIFLPLSLLSCVLAWLYWNHSERLLHAAWLAVVAVLSCAISLPVLTLNKMVVTALFDQGHLPNFGMEWENVSPFTLWVDFCLVLLAFCMQAGFAAWRRSLVREQEIQLSRNLGMELKLHLLQGQLKPHFLFNSLNSISALVRGHDRRVAGKAMYQLQDLLRYVVHSGKHEWVTVAEELQFVRDYLDMQTLRFGDRLQIEFEVSGQDWLRVPCPPLLFQPLVENAIHHGVENHQQASVLEISLFERLGLVHFRICNTKHANQKRKPGHGLGLSSTRERLEILFGSQAQVIVKDSEERFLAEIVFPDMTQV